MLNTDGKTDAWTQSMYFVSTDAATSTSTYTIDVSAGNTAIVGKPFVVHDSGGTRVYCGMLAGRQYSGTPSVVTAVIKFTGVSKVNFDVLTNAVRVAFIKMVKAEAEKGIVAGVQASVTIVRTADSTRRRRLLATSTEVEFTVSVPDAGGLSPDALAAKLGEYVEDGGGLESDINAELATTAPSESVTTDVLSAPAALSSPTTPGDGAGDDPMLIVYISAGVGAAVLLVVVVVAIVVVIVVVVSVQGKKQERLNIALSDTGVEMGDIAAEKNGPLQATAVARSDANSPAEEQAPSATCVAAAESTAPLADPSEAERGGVKVVAAQEPPASTSVTTKEPPASAAVATNEPPASAAVATPASAAVATVTSSPAEDHDMKHFLDGAWFTKAECVAHYGGSVEYDGAPADMGEWFYDDVDHAGDVHGPFMLSKLQSWAAEGHFAVSDLIRNGRDGSPIALSAALGIAEQAGEWFYDDHANPGEVHGPFTRSKLEGWVAAGHFSGSDLVRKGRDGEPIALSKVLGAAEEPAKWFYDDHETPGEVHGPFTRTQLSGWIADGHFTGEDLVRDGREGSPVTLAVAFGEEAVWFYDDHEHPDEKHGPFVLSQIQGWLVDGHFSEADLIRNGREGAPIAIKDAR